MGWTYDNYYHCGKFNNALSIENRYKPVMKQGKNILKCLMRQLSEDFANDSGHL